MPEKCLYDTRFFVEYFYSGDPGLKKKLRAELHSTRERMVSALTVHELHRIDMKKEGKEVALLRSNMLRSDFKVIDVNFEIAVKSAEIRERYPMPMADGIIAATSQIHGCPLFSNDNHFKDIQNLKTRWC